LREDEPAFAGIAVQPSVEGRDCACLAESKSNSHGKLAWARPCVGPRRAGSDSRAGMEQARCFTPKAAHMMDTRGRKEVAAIKWAAHLHGADRPGRSGPRGIGKTAAGGEAERACGGIREPGREKLRKGAGSACSVLGRTKGGHR